MPCYDDRYSLVTYDEQFSLFADVPVRTVDSVIACFAIPVRTFTNGIPLGFCALVMNISQFGTFVECILKDISHTIGDGNRRQSATVLERIKFDNCHAVGYRNRGQSATALERKVPDSGHAGGYGDTGQCTTAGKSTAPNRGHTVGYGDGGQPATAPERIVIDKPRIRMNGTARDGGGSSLHQPQIGIVVIS